MNFSGAMSGLSAVPGGQMAGTEELQNIQQRDLAIKDTQAKQIGMAAYWRALQGMMGTPGQGPMPPNPGQPSMPPGQQMAGAPQGGPPQAPQPMPPGMARPPMPISQQGMPQGGPPPGAAPAPPQGQPQGMPPGQEQPGGQGPGSPEQPMSWQRVVMAIKQHNPNLPDQALAAAVDHFMPMMTMQSKLEWQKLRNDLLMDVATMKTDASRDNTRDRTDAQRDVAGIRSDTSRANTTDRIGQRQTEEEGRSGRAATAEDRRERAMGQRQSQFDQREERLTKGLKLREDSTWARLDQSKQALQQRIQAGDKTRAVTEYRAALDAQHKRAMEIIQSTSMMNNMKPDERQKFLKEQNAWYNGELDKLQNLATTRGNVTDMGTPVSTTVEDAPPKPAAPAGTKAVPTQSFRPPVAQEAAPAGPKPPQVGEVRNGYKFKGGAPNDPNSWEKVDAL